MVFDGSSPAQHKKNIMMVPAQRSAKKTARQLQSPAQQKIQTQKNCMNICEIRNQALSLESKTNIMIPYTQNISEKELIYKIKGLAYEIRNELGRFLHERPYQMALEHALRKVGIDVHREVSIHAVYDGIDCGRAFSVDILISPDIVLELKATPEMMDVQYAQLRNYMNLLHSPFGMLINFGVKDFKDGIHIMKAIPTQFPKNKAFPFFGREESIHSR